MMGRMADYFDRSLLFLVSLSTISMVVLTFEQVVTRYLFNQSSVAIQELLWHLFGFSFLVASGITLKLDRHVRVDIFYSHMSLRTKNLIDIFGIIFFILPAMLILTWYGISYVEQSRSFGVSELASIPTGTSNSFLEALMVNLRTFLDTNILVGEGSPDPGGLPARWIGKSLIPLGGILCLFSSLQILFKKISLVLNRSAHGA